MQRTALFFLSSDMPALWGGAHVVPGGGQLSVPLPDLRVGECSSPAVLT